jgi:beta-glucanase (GH16 family)
MEKKYFTIICFLILAITVNAQWSLVWSDEFDYTGAPDSKKWAIETGPGLYNGELQYYKNSSNNVRVENGNMILEVIQESYGGRNYTSGKVYTKTKAYWTGGKFEARLLLPKGNGIWPAFWMMPVSDTYGTWPASGEIDIMEWWSWDANATFGNYHVKDYYGKYGKRVSVTNPSANWHVYAIQWSSSKIEFLLDNVIYATYNNPGTGSTSWPFDKPFYIILNVAVEGSSPGNEGTWTKKTMEIDYVRVYNSTVSVQEENSYNLNIYPNPAYDMLTVSRPNTFDDCSISIFNILGRQVKYITSKEQDIHIPISELQPGIYVASVNDKYKKVFVKK